KFHPLINYNINDTIGVKKMNEWPKVKCPICLKEENIDRVLTAQSNQNVIYHCPSCGYEIRNIYTNKG
ncbi:MAG TPA: hypothetical protein VEY51_14580, partial [Chondromyces sp.]|nr:hypothetical protein [Chondromyces sp.]